MKPEPAPEAGAKGHKSVGHVPGPRTAPSYDLVELGKSLKDAHDSVTVASGEVTPEAYEKLCRMGEVVTFIKEPVDNAIKANKMQAIEELLGSATAQPAEVEKIAKWAGKLLAADANSKGGVLLAGTVSG